MEIHAPAVWIFLASEAVAAWLIYRLWRSGDPLFFKISLSLIALFPLLGPLLVLWVSDFPDPEPDALQDRGYRGDFYRRWQSVLEERNPIRRFRYWRDRMSKDSKEDL